MKRRKKKRNHLYKKLSSEFKIIFMNIHLAQSGPETFYQFYQSIVQFFSGTFAKIFGLPDYYFTGSNIIFYFFLPIITGVYFTYLFLMNVRIFYNKTVNWLLAFAMGFFLVFLGRNALFI